MDGYVGEDSGEIEGCMPDCDGKECGDDGCDGECGTCDPGQVCIDHNCPPVGDECDDNNGSDWDGCTGGKLTEFAVNTTTDGDQGAPDVATFPDEGGVVAWHSDGEDGDGFGVYAALFFPGPGGVGAVVPVNVTTDNQQQYPSVAVPAQDRFVVVWQSTQQDQVSWEVLGRIFDRDGEPLTGELDVSTTTTAQLTGPRVAALPGTGFVVVWGGAGETDGSGICARRFGPDGTGLDVLQTVVNVELDQEQEGPAVAGLDDGRYVVAWQSHQQDGDGWGVYLRGFNSGGDQWFPEKPVTQTTQGDQTAPMVTALAGGGFAVAWSGQGALDDAGVMARLFDDSGSPATDEFAVNTTLVEMQAGPCLTSLTPQALGFAWESEGQDGDGKGVVVRSLTPDGLEISSETQANVYSDGEQSRPRCGRLADGTLVVTWQSKDLDGSGFGIVVRRFDTSMTGLYH